MTKKTEDITLYLYYMGDYKMKYEHLTREEANKILDHWNGIEFPGWFAQEKNNKNED
jgi:hypothetical protein